MDTTTVDRILNNNYTRGDALRILPKEFTDQFMIFGYEPEDMTMEGLCIETPGDLNELVLMHIRDQVENTKFRFEKFMEITKWAMASCTVMGHQEFTQHETWKVFNQMYPSIGETILVWAWG